MEETEAPIYHIATANSIKRLPPALLRRFDDIFWVDYPGEDAREEIFSIHLQKRKQEPGGFDLGKLAEMTHLYTGAEIEKVIKTGLEYAFMDGSELTMEHLESAVGDVIPIPHTMQKEINATREDMKGRARWASAPLELPEAKKAAEEVLEY